MSLRESRQIYKIDDIYYDTPIVNGKFLDFYEPRNFTFADDDDFVIVEKRHEFRPYVLAYDLYSSDKLWWIFPKLNMDTLIDPIRDLREGLVLRVPTQERVLSELTG